MELVSIPLNLQTTNIEYQCKQKFQLAGLENQSACMVTSPESTDGHEQFRQIINKAEADLQES